MSNIRSENALAPRIAGENDKNTQEELKNDLIANYSKFTASIPKSVDSVEPWIMILCGVLSGILIIAYLVYRCYYKPIWDQKRQDDFVIRMERSLFTQQNPGVNPLVYSYLYTVDILYMSYGIGISYCFIRIINYIYKY